MLHAAALFEPTPYVEDADVDADEAPLETARRDALPEHATYRDEGCDAHPSCLTCPFVRCRYDVSLRMQNETRDAEMRAMRRAGVKVTAIAEHFGVARRTVFRVLALPRP